MKEEIMFKTKETISAPGTVGTEYNEVYHTLLKALTKDGDPIAVEAAKGIESIQRTIDLAKAGQINKRRSLIQRDIREKFDELLTRLETYRQALHAEADEAARKQAEDYYNRRVDETKALRELMEMQYEVKSLSNHELETRAMNAENATPPARLMHYKNATEYRAHMAEMRERGLTKQADKLREIYDGLPVQGIGDVKTMQAAARAAHYAQRPKEPGTIFAKDGEGKLQAVQLDWCLSGGELSEVPE